jgi:hypothetical protein
VFAIGRSRMSGPHSHLLCDGSIPSAVRVPG